LTAGNDKRIIQSGLKDPFWGGTDMVGFAGITKSDYSELSARNPQPMLEKLNYLMDKVKTSLIERRHEQARGFRKEQGEPEWASVSLVKSSEPNPTLQPQLNLTAWHSPRYGPRVEVRLLLMMESVDIYTRRCRCAPAASMKFLKLDAARMTKLAKDKGLEYQAWLPVAKGDYKLILPTPSARFEDLLEATRAAVIHAGAGEQFEGRCSCGSIALGKVYTDRDVIPLKEKFADQAFDVLYYIYTKLPELWADPAALSKEQGGIVYR
jgi:hypothetical protein